MLKAKKNIARQMQHKSNKTIELKAKKTDEKVT